MRRYICLLFIGLIVGIEKISAEDNLTPAADGWYEVRTPEELCWISEWVNSGNTRINVRLMNDLDMRSIENFTPIGMYTDTGGLPSRSFQGIFDGQKHVIYNLNVYREDTYECGLFSRINGGGTLCNLGVVNASVANMTGVRVGILAGEIHLSTVRNCFSAGDIGVYSSGQRGGIAGECYDSQIYDSYTTFESLGNYGTYTNCYASLEMAQTGELCFLLNGSSMDNPTWYQTIGKDKYPVWDSTHGLVYAIGDGTFGDIHDKASFKVYRDRILQKEFDYLSSVTATASLTDNYKSALENLSSITELNAFQQEFSNLDYLKASVMESAEAYSFYLKKIEDVLDYLKENPIGDGIDKEFLMEYLQEDDGPGAYPNGTSLFILRIKRLSADEISAETQYLQALLSKAIVNGYGTGAEVTAILKNADFNEGWTGWDGQMPTNYGGTLNMRTAECRNTPCDIHQTLTDIANGVYLFEINGAFCPAGMVSNTNYAAMVYANGMQNYLQVVCEDAIDVSKAQDGMNCYLAEDWEVTDDLGRTLAYAMHGTTGAAYAFLSGRYKNAILTQVVDGSLTIGIKVPGSGNNSDWAGFGNIRLVYCGTLDQATDALNEVLESQLARVETLLAYESCQGEDCVYYPNYSAQLQERLYQAKAAAEIAETVEEKYEMIHELSTLFQEIYDCKMAYREMGKQMNNMYDASFYFEGSDDLNEMEELYGRVWDNYYRGTYTAEEALSMADRLRVSFPDYLKITGSRSLNNISFSQIGSFAYQVNTLGNDPYVSTSSLSDDLQDDQTIISFEYRTSHTLTGGEFFFAEPLAGGREQTYQTLPPANDWTAVFVDISESRKSFDWGHSGNWLRWDPLPNGTVQVDIRNLRIVNAEQKQEIIDSVPRAIEAKILPDSGVFDLQGRELRVGKNLEGLPRGVYLVGNKKVLH